MSRTEICHRRLCQSVGLGLVVAAVSCGGRERTPRSPDGAVSAIETDQYVRRAIRSSSEGVILIPSQRAERMFELPRLNEIAQRMRGPAARCFLARAIETMEPSAEREQGYEQVPEGQIKLRVRISASGKVLRAEVLETGFADQTMEPCLLDVFAEPTWPPNRSGSVYFVDAVYWVSLGAQRGIHSEAMATHIRREQVAAGRRGKACLQGRVGAGSYPVDGLNLLDKEGATLVNRIDSATLGEPIRLCLATAFRQIRLPRDPDAFVRPIAPRVTFNVDHEGMVHVEGEQWLELLELEERAQRAEQRAQQLATEAELIDELPPRRPPPSSPEEPVPPPAAPLGLQDPLNPGTPTAESEGHDPAQGGLRIDLGGPRRNDGA